MTAPAPAIALAKRTDFDWDTIFDGADWFHWTGITPALGGELPEICLDACKAGKARGLTFPAISTSAKSSGRASAQARS